MTEDSKETFQFEVNFQFMLNVLTLHINEDGSDYMGIMAEIKDKVWENIRENMADNEIRRMILLEYECDDEIELEKTFPPIYSLFSHLEGEIWKWKPEEENVIGPIMDKLIEEGEK